MSIYSSRTTPEMRAARAAKRKARLESARALGTHTLREWFRLVVFCDCRCVKCGSEDDIHKDHIRPIAHGGSDAIENLQPLCRACNCGKSLGDGFVDYRPEGWREYVFGSAP